MREFTTAAEAVEGQGETFGKEVTFTVDGREVTFLPATEGQIALVLASNMQDGAAKVSIFVNFFFGLLRDTRDIDEFKRRLFDRADPFGATEITDIVLGLIEEWTGNPTGSSSDSTQSQDSTGGPSTPSVPRTDSTPSAFGLTASAT